MKIPDGFSGDVYINYILTPLIYDPSNLWFL
jgi:hypothetical protein